jgi:hypothetical protein
MISFDSSGNIYKSKPEPRLLPKRIVEVGSLTEDPRLIRPPEGSSGQYVALSYCWGVRPQIALTVRLAESKNCHFILDTLPPTIRDAVIICRRLGFRYLWVDTLCIIQDSPNAEDWVQQSARMDEIYGNASLTLAAAAGTSVWDGMLVPTTDIPPVACSIPFKNGNKAVPIIEIPGSQVNFRFYPYDIDQRQPLAMRAWTFQEEAMSHRMLKFHKEQLVWQCKSGKLYADGPVNIEQLSICKSWEESVVEYTSRNLTFEDDRLMALSGYARSKQKGFISQGVQNRYVAGLWEKDLVNHLLWISKVKPPSPRPTTYRAPTWSWASINGPVEFVTEERKGGRYCTIKLLSIFLATNPSNPFGTLNNTPPSYIHMKGFLKGIPGIEIPSNNAPLPIHRNFRQNTGRNWWIEFDIIDVEERLEQALTVAESQEDTSSMLKQKVLYCLRLTEFTALILVPLSKRNGVICFERVGIIRHWHRQKWDWFDEVNEKTELYLM